MKKFFGLLKINIRLFTSSTENFAKGFITFTHYIFSLMQIFKYVCVSPLFMVNAISGASDEIPILNAPPLQSIDVKVPDHWINNYEEFDFRYLFNIIQPTTTNEPPIAITQKLKMCSKYLIEEPRLSTFSCVTCSKIKIWELEFAIKDDDAIFSMWANKYFPVKIIQNLGNCMDISLKRMSKKEDVEKYVNVKISVSLSIEKKFKFSIPDDNVPYSKWMHNIIIEANSVYGKALKRLFLTQNLGVNNRKMTLFKLRKNFLDNDYLFVVFKITAAEQNGFMYMKFILLFLNSLETLPTDQFAKEIVKMGIVYRLMENGNELCCYSEN